MKPVSFSAFNRWAVPPRILATTNLPAQFQELAHIIEIKSYGLIGLKFFGNLYHSEFNAVPLREIEYALDVRILFILKQGPNGPFGDIKDACRCGLIYVAGVAILNPK